MNENSYRFKRYADEQYPRHYSDMRPNGFGIVGCLDLDYVSVSLPGYEPSCLDQSNHATVLADLQSIDERVTTVYLHGADMILIPLVGPVVDAAASWLNALADYPVADEMNLSERETADLLETLTACYDVADEMADAVAHELFDSHSISRSEECTMDRVADARLAVARNTLEALGLTDADRETLARELFEEACVTIP